MKGGRGRSEREGRGGVKGGRGRSERGGASGGGIERSEGEE